MPLRALEVEPAVAAEPFAPPSPEAFRQVYQDHFEFVWRYAAHRGVPADARDDIVQEVFLVVYRKLCSFEGRSSLRTWIAGITLNVLRSHRRRAGASLIAEPLPIDMPGSERSAADALELKQALVITNLALAKMSDLQREAFVLCELDGLSGNEIAELHGINVHTFRARLRSARLVFNEVTERVRRRGGVK